VTRNSIPRRQLGSTGLEVSVLGLGGFHQIEIGQTRVTSLLDAYLAADGNYVEVARGYGGGAAERKIGVALEGRRDQVVLASKSRARDAEGAWRELNESLEALKTDHLDLWLYHCLTGAKDVAQIASPGGAKEAYSRAKEEGLVRFIGASTHWPLALLPAMACLELDTVMYWINYLVACNYPELYRTIAPRAREKGIGIIGMKPLADGYLHRSIEPAFGYALAQEVDVLACGFNSLEMLQQDIEAVCAWQRPTEEQLDVILRDAPELGDTVCRQCGACEIDQVNIPRVFELEGKFDRQMFDGRPHSAPEYALRQRLCGWFGNQQRAIELYRPHATSVQALLASDLSLPECPFGIDIREKLDLADAKLTSDGRFPAGGRDF